MVRIEELMQYASRRKVEAIATEMGYSKATEYPDEVLKELQARCSKKRRSHAAVAEEATNQETINTAREDLKDVDEGSQHRAAALRVAGDALTLFYYASAQFTVPGLKEKVEESRNNLRQALKGVAAAYDPEHFLAQTQLAQMVAGRNGSMRSLNGNSSPSDESKLEEDGE